MQKSNYFNLQHDQLIMDEMTNLDHFLPISLSIKRLIRIAARLDKYESIIPVA
jgi:hypothetical protein